MPMIIQKSEHFASAKTPQTIEIGSEHFRDALIRATLDPAVRSIERLPQTLSAKNLAMIVRDDGLFIYGVDRAVRSCVEIDPAKSAPFGRVLLPECEIYREPAISNQRLVWSYKQRRVSNGLRIQILLRLAAEGSIRIAGLCSALRIPNRSAAAVFAMACADLIELPDIALKPLDSDSIVRRRSAPMQRPTTGCFARNSPLRVAV